MFTRLLRLFTCVFLTTSWVHAEFTVPLSIEALTGHADWVVRGRPVSKTCLRDAKGMIYTRLEFVVEDVWKGELASQPLIVVQTGGTLGEESVEPPGQATLEVGEEVLLFLARNPRGEGVVVGLHQGKFEISREASGAIQVHNRFHGLPSSGSAGERAIQHQLGRRLLSLEALKQQVKDSAK